MVCRGALCLLLLGPEACQVMENLIKQTRRKRDEFPKNSKGYQLPDQVQWSSWSVCWEVQGLRMPYTADSAKAPKARPWVPKTFPGSIESFFGMLRVIGCTAGGANGCLST